ncbi:hypothetical protein [Bacillus amyloliquefaciens]|uniref:hypothetical protein n=1 Tax=Bacillus amyloliquefaciens TaxID=1390 RepID=UPI000A47ECB8|nr:hypothetical protein [Bacillus amyloliquefaciens]
MLTSYDFKDQVRQRNQDVRSAAKRSKERKEFFEGYRAFKQIEITFEEVGGK